ncbi:hypothetical protein KUV22_16315 [Microbulbifer agarilyticus]|uniref:hypothetical protein n=1 Tax=Microbulbifer agarilyticus TaxID=260552 RepID=UPI001C972B02|nr:hypothetical protein [Microbulbifer agarilyticus]MBY6191993.1 hypothetical protein [Microbulbifer agarilyticus]
MHEYEVKRLRTRSIFKIIFVGMTLSIVPLFAISGVLASIGLVKLYWGSEPLTGGSAIIGGPLVGIFIAVTFSFFASILTSLGLILYGKKRTLTMYYYPIEKNEAS